MYIPTVTGIWVSIANAFITPTGMGRGKHGKLLIWMGSKEEPSWLESFLAIETQMKRHCLCLLLEQPWTWYSLVLLFQLTRAELDSFFEQCAKLKHFPFNTLQRFHVAFGFLRGTEQILPFVCV